MLDLKLIAFVLWHWIIFRNYTALVHKTGEYIRFWRAVLSRSSTWLRSDSRDGPLRTTVPWCSVWKWCASKFHPVAENREGQKNAAYPTKNCCWLIKNTCGFKKNNNKVLVSENSFATYLRTIQKSHTY